MYHSMLHVGADAPRISAAKRKHVIYTRVLKYITLQIQIPMYLTSTDARIFVLTQNTASITHQPNTLRVCRK
jgi:hypothetical protein